MKQQSICISILALSLLLVGCGTGKGNSDEDVNNKGSTMKKDSSEWATIEVVSNRNIIAELKQTNADPKIRNEAFAKVKENEDLTNGLFGKVTPELEEDMAVQWIEADAAFKALEEAYGGQDSISSEGVVFLENQASGADQSGFWLGIKEPDDRLKRFVDILQKKVDAGEILAKHIYIFKSTHTEKENFALTDTVSAAVQKIAKNHPTPNRLSGGVSVDTITGTVEISHDFLTEKQKEDIQKQFPAEKFNFTQEGRMVAGPGETDISYPSDPTTNEPSTEGAYVLSISDTGMLVVDAMAKDFSATGGVSEFYSAINFTYPNANEKLEVGQRVLVESGPIMESYPGQGGAKYVEVLPTYKPENADLTEAEVVRAALDQSGTKSGWVVPISNVSFDETADRWSVEFAPDQEEPFKVTIEDVIK